MKSHSPKLGGAPPHILPLLGTLVHAYREVDPPHAQGLYSYKDPRKHTVDSCRLGPKWLRLGRKVQVIRAPPLEHRASDFEDRGSGSEHHASGLEHRASELGGQGVLRVTSERLSDCEDETVLRFLIFLIFSCSLIFVRPFSVFDFQECRASI